MDTIHKDSIYRQRRELAELLRDPIEAVAVRLGDAWPDKPRMEALLLDGFSGIPYCTSLYVLDARGIQLTENIGRQGRVPGHYRRDSSLRPYMQEAMPPWGSSRNC